MAGTLIALLGLLVAILVPLASFVTGLRSTDPLWLWKRPRLLARSLVAILIVVPVIEVVLARTLAPDDIIVRTGVVISILAVGVGPPALLKQTEAPEELVRYEIGLNVVLMTVAAVYMPVAVAIHGAVFHHDLSLPWLPVARVVVLKAILPFFLGVAAARWFPKLAASFERVAPRLLNGATAVVALVALMAVGRHLIALGARTWLTCALIALVAVSIGHASGGPTRERRAVLARFSALRFPALALLLTSIVPRSHEVIPVVIVYAISSTLLVGAYYAALAKREHPVGRSHTRPARS